MNTLKKILAATLMAALILPSCDDDDDVMENQEFVTQASSSNNLEIAASDLALTKSQNTAIIAFANHMKTDHGMSGQELTALASTKGWAISPSLMQEHQKNYDMLPPLNGTDFNRKFAELMVSSHTEAVSLFRRASSNEEGVRDGDLRSWAAGKLPALEHHLEEAISLRAEMMK